MRMLSRYWHTIGFAIFTFVPAGCIGNTEPKLVPVVGRITLGNYVVDRGTITLYPDAAGANFTSSAAIRSDGYYEITTFGKLGAPVGSYRVAITPFVQSANPSAPAHVVVPPVPNKYSEPFRSQLILRVVTLPAAGAYDLHLTP